VTVRDFPKPEPWPDELFDMYGLADLHQLQRDVTAAIARRQGLPVAACPDCGSSVHPSATVCEDCGAHLTPSYTTAPARDQLDAASEPGQKEAIMAPVVGCTCGGNGLCTRCVLAQYDRDPFAQALAHAVDVVTRPVNVVSLDRYSKKVRP
jgi:hypothetical protein